MEAFGVLNFMTYLLGTVLIILLPGPNSLYVLALSAQKGVKMGWRGAFGIFLGDFILMLATAAGAVTLLTTYPMLFSILQYIGAAYLAYIGAKLIWSAIQTWPKHQDVQAVMNEASEQKLGKEAPFRKALLVSLLNPKAILFFLSFFMQFVDPAYPSPAVPFMILAVTLQICSAVYLTTLIYAGNYLAEAFRKRKKLSAVSAGGTGAAFMGFAVKLASASALS
ncbi:MAG: leucine efflux protein LeuE [Proteobacteria bacterium]|nr:MAG: leucine efflux protein LeuE [Pseudomonadota bacterium]